MSFKKRRIMNNVWFHFISTYSQYSEVFIVLCHTTSNLPPNAQIDHFSYAYFRVLFLARDGRRQAKIDMNLPWSALQLNPNYGCHLKWI